MEFNFEKLPKYMKEKIWENLDEEELFKLRIISKDWKEEIENPISPRLKKNYLEAKEKSEKYLNGKYFYKDFKFTASFLALKGRHGKKKNNF
jgi:hypothetical protein